MIATCHPNKINKGRGLCGTCYDKILKQENKNYRLSQIKNTTNWFKLNPQKRKEYNEKRRIREEADPLRYQKKRELALLKKYGINQKNYDELLEKQKGGCAICERKPSIKPLHVDHCHKTGIVRGLLCHQCNWYLGTVESGTNILDRIKNYLEIK